MNPLPDGVNEPGLNLPPAELAVSETVRMIEGEQPFDRPFGRVRRTVGGRQSVERHGKASVRGELMRLSVDDDDGRVNARALARKRAGR